MKQMDESELKEVASQLSLPKGEAGKRTAEHMAVSNENMIGRTIQLLNIRANERVLEIGHGNASHLKSVIDFVDNVHYTGIDISITMIEEASRINESLLQSGHVSFLLSDGLSLNFPTNHFDKIFTVNTLYFWKEPKAYAAEIYRVLKPGGSFCLSFATKDFMERLPFTKWEFQLYTVEMGSELLKEAGFSTLDITEEKETIKTGADTTAVRDIVIIRAEK